jgi:hypothetical protein
MTTNDNNIRLVAAEVSQDELSYYDQSRNDDDSSEDGVRIATSKTETEEIPVNHETQAANRSKLLMYLALIIIIVAVGATAFLLTTKEEQESVEAKVRLQGIGWRPKTEKHYISAYNNLLLLHTVYRVDSRSPRQGGEQRIKYLYR